ncbi:MAG: 4-alpha-glucanotransferase [Kofleriaceae bacterium]|nr:4-alpha-glucanotransferase [Kofleriaceae bacterium]
MNTLRELAKSAGLDVAYHNWRGALTFASDETVLATLRALAPDLGIRIDSPEDAAHAITVLERERWRQIVPPVVLGWDGSIVIPFAVPADDDQPWEVEVTTESGHVVRAHGRLFELPADSHAWPGGVCHCIRRATVFLDGENGYHSARWRTAGGQGEAFAIAAPLRAWGGPGAGPKRWGVFSPVYGLASQEAGEAGDLGSLRQLFHAINKRGGRYVGILPILAAFLDPTGGQGEPFMFSPYSPASRLYWNELYLELAPLAAEVGLPAPVAPPIVAGTRIDYRAHYQRRRPLIDAIAERLLAGPRAAEIDAWAQQTGTYDYAAFRAFGEQQHAPWCDWPSPWRDNLPLVETQRQAVSLGADAGRLGTHVVAQWAMQRQLEALTGGPVQLYIDLPVGVNLDAYEVWRHRHLFLTTLATGAPPDALFLGGQNWGLPPLSPTALRRDRYRYFIRSVQHHMRVAGMLRIDHVMGLFRLYCVPEGRPATDGVYLRYNAEELMAILTLESSRMRCAVAGEDLGTVPDHVRPAMTRHGMFRLHVGQWSLPARVGDPPRAAPAEAIASLNTHDTATFAGWWRGADIDDRRDLGLITAQQEATERVERDTSRRAVLAHVQAAIGGAGDTLTEVERAMVGATTDLAVGPAEIVLVALDDLVLEPVPHNVPGTVTERPNWQRRVDRWSDSLDEQRGTPAATAAINAVVAARSRS